MAPRLTPRSGCPGRPTLPCPCPALFVTTDREWAPQGTGSDWKNLPGTAHTDRHHVALIYKMLKPSVFKSSTQNVFIPPRDAIRKKRSRNTSIDTHKVCFEKPLETQIIHLCMYAHICSMGFCLKLFTQWLMQILLHWKLLYILQIIWATTCKLSILSIRNNITIDYKYYFHTL
jgi:hypothetical protein